MMRYAILILFLLTTRVSGALSPILQCQLALRFASGEMTVAQAVVKSYRQILGDLGQDLVPGTFATMGKSGDPFSLPTGTRVTSETLPAALKEFQSMLEESGHLRDPQLTTSLLEVLKDLSENKRKVHKAQEENTKASSRRDIPFPSGKTLTHPQFTPDGKYLIAEDRISSGFWFSKNRQPFQQSIGKDFPYVPTNLTFSRDGRHIFFSSSSPQEKVYLYRAQVMDAKGNILPEWKPEIWAALGYSPLQSYKENRVFPNSDGSALLFESGANIYRIPTDKPVPDSKIPPSIFSNNLFCKVFPSPDGKEFAILDERAHAIHFLDEHGKEVRPLWTPGFSTFTNHLVFTKLGPLLYGISNHGSDDNYLVQLSPGAKGGLGIHLEKEPYTNQKILRTIPTDDHLFFNSGNGKIATIDPAQHKIVKELPISHPDPESLEINSEDKTAVIQYDSKSYHGFSIIELNELLP